jgi:hypothetical protein
MPHARTTDPATSHDAAASVNNVTKTQNRILDLLATPMTDQKLVEEYQWWSVGNTDYVPAASESGIRSRRAELVSKGLVVDTGDRTLLRSGRRAIVWGVAK